MSKCVKCSSPPTCRQTAAAVGTLYRVQPTLAEHTKINLTWECSRAELSTVIIKSLVTFTSGWKRLQTSDAVCYRQSQIYHWCICHTLRWAQTQASAAAQLYAISQKWNGTKTPALHPSAVKPPRPTTNLPHASSCMISHTENIHPGKELAEANPYQGIWEFPFLKSSLIVLTSYLACLCPQSCYVAYFTWLLHSKRLAGSAGIWSISVNT